MLVSLDTLVAGAIAGQLVSFPTDTVPALAALPAKGALIYEAKQRHRDKPLILMAAEVEDFWPFVRGSDEEYKIWQSVARKYWPGALTLVLPASEQVSKEMIPAQLGDDKTIGIRVPNSAIARKILAKTSPLATTSANLSGQPPLEKMVEIEANFPDVLVLAPTEYNESDTHRTGVPSTVAKWTGDHWQILRQGAIKLEF
ncbi:MAG: L-threonylcarbamoyladenylate synthase [Scytonema sp. PMC 1069.18]|nr:L-threonylcarbamoyladenylate synthase [Scytonema sp. PMC 1069.18]MEC4885258.1 L-threonylcarbamoyladenylate synthase [Scytonema sp. PMC 1070.18]